MSVLFIIFFRDYEQMPHFIFLTYTQGEGIIIDIVIIIIIVIVFLDEHYFIILHNFPSHMVLSFVKYLCKLT